MKRFRLSTLLLLIVIVGLGLGLAVQQRKIARLENDLRRASEDLRNMREGQLHVTIKVPEPVVSSTVKRTK